MENHNIEDDCSPMDIDDTSLDSTLRIDNHCEWDVSMKEADLGNDDESNAVQQSENIVYTSSDVVNIESLPIRSTELQMITSNNQSQDFIQNVTINKNHEIIPTLSCDLKKSSIETSCLNQMIDSLNDQDSSLKTSIELDSLITSTESVLNEHFNVSTDSLEITNFKSEVNNSQSVTDKLNNSLASLEPVSNFVNANSVTDKLNNSLVSLEPVSNFVNANSTVCLVADKTFESISSVNDMTRDTSNLNVDTIQKAENAFNTMHCTLDKLNQSNVSSSTDFKIEIKNEIVNFNENVGNNLKSMTVKSDISNKNNFKFENPEAKVITSTEEFSKGKINTSLNSCVEKSPNSSIKKNPECQMNDSLGESGDILKTAEIVNISSKEYSNVVPKADNTKIFDSLKPLPENSGSLQLVKNDVSCCLGSNEYSNICETVNTNYFEKTLSSSNTEKCISNLEVSRILHNTKDQISNSNTSLDFNEKLRESELLESGNILNTELAIIPSGVTITSPKILTLEKNVISVNEQQPKETNKMNENVVSDASASHKLPIKVTTQANNLMIESPDEKVEIIKYPNDCLQNQNINSSWSNEGSRPDKIQFSEIRNEPNVLQQNHMLLSDLEHLIKSQSNSINSNEVLQTVSHHPIDSQSNISDNKSTYEPNQEQNTLISTNLNVTEVIRTDTPKSDTSVLAKTKELENQTQSISKLIQAKTIPLNLDQLSSCIVSNSSKSALSAELVRRLSSSEMVVSPDFTEKEQEVATLALFASIDQNKFEKVVDESDSGIFDRTLTNNEQVVGGTSFSKLEKNEKMASKLGQVQLQKDSKHEVFDSTRPKSEKIISMLRRVESHILNTTLPKDGHLVSESQNVAISNVSNTIFPKDEQTFPMDSKLGQVEISAMVDSDLNNTTTIKSSNLSTINPLENNPLNITNENVLLVNDTITIEENEINNTTHSNLNVTNIEEDDLMRATNTVTTENLNVTNIDEENPHIMIDKECLNATNIISKVNPKPLENDSTENSTENMLETTKTITSDNSLNLSETQNITNKINNTITHSNLNVTNTEKDDFMRATNTVITEKLNVTNIVEENPDITIDEECLNVTNIISKVNSKPSENASTENMLETTKTIIFDNSLNLSKTQNITNKINNAIAHSNLNVTNTEEDDLMRATNTVITENLNVTNIVEENPDIAIDEECLNATNIISKVNTKPSENASSENMLETTKTIIFDNGLNLSETQNITNKINNTITHSNLNVTNTQEADLMRATNTVTTENLNMTNAVEENPNITIDEECLNVTNIISEVNTEPSDNASTENMVEATKTIIFDNGLNLSETQNITKTVNLNVTNVLIPDNANTRTKDISENLSESNITDSTFNSTIVMCNENVNTDKILIDNTDILSKQKNDSYIFGLVGEIVKVSVDKSQVKDMNKSDCQLRFDKSFEKKVDLNEKKNSLKLLPCSASVIDVGRVSPKRVDLVQVHKLTSPDSIVNLKKTQNSKATEIEGKSFLPKISITAVSRKSDKFTSLDDTVDMGAKSLLSSTKMFEESFNAVCANNNPDDQDGLVCDSSFSKSPNNIVKDNQSLMEDRNPFKKINSNSKDSKTKKVEETVMPDVVMKAEQVLESKMSYENKENFNLSIFSKSPAKPSRRRDTLFQLFDPLYESYQDTTELHTISPQLHTREISNKVSSKLISLDEGFNPADVALTSCNQIKEDLSDESDLDTFLKSLPERLHCFKAKMDDAIDEKMRMEQELNELKLELNQLQQERTTLQLELHQKEEVILKIQGEAQKIGNQYKHEIKQLQDKLNTINEQNNNEEVKILKEEISKLKDRDIQLNEKNSKLLDQISSLESTVLHFETTLDRVIKESEKVRGDHDNTKKHLATLELSFSDVHAKYERTKEFVVAYKNNEEVLADKLEKSEEIARRYEERYDTLKAHAKAQIDKANKELSAVKEKHQLELNKMTALLRRLEIKCGSIQQALDQKTKECAALAALCDEMAGSVPQ